MRSRSPGRTPGVFPTGQRCLFGCSLERHPPPDPPPSRGRELVGLEPAVPTGGSSLSSAPMSTALWEWLRERAVEIHVADHLCERLRRGESLRVKLGLDPTAPDLH